MKRSIIVLLVMSIATAACNWFDDPAPDEVRLRVEGDAGKTVRLVISTRFVASVNELQQTRIVLFESDTIVTTLPFERVYAINEDQRFFAETARFDTDLQNVRMQVFIDARSKFDEVGELVNDQPYRFVYTFNQLVTREIVVL